MPKTKEPALNTLNHHDHLKMVYCKSCVVKDGRVEYDHLGEHYIVAIEDTEISVEGEEILINAALEIQYAGNKIGNGKRL